MIALGFLVALGPALTLFLLGRIAWGLLRRTAQPPTTPRSPQSRETTSRPRAKHPWTTPLRPAQ